MKTDNHSLDFSTAKNWWRTPASVTVLYAIFSSLWISASGALLILSVDDPALLRWIEIGKGLLFVLVTSSLLFLLLRQWHDILPGQAVPAAPVRSKKLHGRILAFFVLAAVVPLSGFLVIKVHGPQIEREALNELKAIAELKAHQIELWINERNNNGLAIFSSPAFAKQVLAFQQTGRQQAREEIRASLISAVDSAQYDAASLLDPEGRELFVLGEHSQNTPKIIELLSKAQSVGQTVCCDMFIDADGHSHLDFVVPVFLFENGSRRPIGAVILHTLPQKILFPHVRSWPTGSTSGETLLVRRDGDSLIFIDEPRHRQGDGANLRWPLIGGTGAPPFADAVQKAHSGTYQGKDYRGVPVFAAYHPVIGTDWMLVAKLDRDEALAPLHNLAFWVSLIALLAIAVVSAVMLMLWRQRWRTQRLEVQAQSDKFLRQFYDLPFIGIAIMSPEPIQWVKCNDRLCEILGYSNEEITKLDWQAITHPDDLAASASELERVMQGESDGYELDKRFIRKDGAIVFASINLKCLRNADGSLEYIFATVQDITERKQSEARIQRLTRIYAALSECNQAIVRCTNKEELFEQICRIVVQLGGMITAWVGLIDPKTLMVRPVAGFGEGTEFLQEMQVSADAESPFGRGATGTAIRELKPCWIQDYQNDPMTLPWRERGARSWWKSLAALPLTRDGVAIGAMTLYASEVGAFSTEERELFAEMAQDIDFALATFAKEEERQRIEAALRESESRFRDLYEKAPLAYQSLDISGNILEVNAAWLDLLGRTREEVIGRFLGDFLTDASAKALKNEFPRFQKKGRVNGALFHFVHKDGSQRVLMVNGQVARDKNGNFLRTHCIMTDLTERTKAEEQLRLSAQVFEQGGEGIMITDANFSIVMVNRAFVDITGYSEIEIVGKNPRILSSGRHDRSFYRGMWEEINTHGFWRGEIWNRRKEGDVFPELLSISRVLDTRGKISHYIGIFSDISEHKASQEHIQRLAHFDSLTGLPNRSLLADRVGQALSRVERNGEQLALIFLDLDRFKNVNDSLGHRIGDELLIQVAERLKTTIRDEDTVSRLGGDEFILVLPDTNADGASHVAEKILKTLSRPYHIEQHELTITPSMGIALYPTDGTSYESLSMCADAAMYRAKQGGRNTFCFFTKEMQERSDRALQLENTLRRALEFNQLQLLYQPQISLTDNRIIGAEALLRWSHPELGLISPGDFIPVAEDSGLILPIGEWVLRTAIHQMKTWIEEGMAPMVMAVNLSAVQFRQSKLPELISNILEEFGLPPHCLELELTEGVAMDNPLAAISVMNDLHERGVRMSIDDFGTGYSSLSYLKRFKVYKLKIDQTFVRDISSDPEDAAIVEAIIGLSKSLGMQTIAEGVETAEQLAFLRMKGCDEVQGYYFGKPMPAGEFETFARDYRSA